MIFSTLLIRYRFKGYPCKSDMPLLIKDWATKENKYTFDVTKIVEIKTE